jgi:hypothetical protein
LQFSSSDFDEILANTSGRLPSDLGHRFYVDLAKERRIGHIVVEVATRFTLSSGRTRSVIGESALYGPVYLLPRGSAERYPMLSTTDLRLAARWGRTAISLQALNLFNRQEVTGADEAYAQGLLTPIDGGDATDLPFLKTATGVPVRRSLSYGTPITYHPPLSLVLGVESQF